MLSPDILVQLTKLNGKPFILNALYIETIEAIPDTMITLTNGRKYVVAEPKENVIERINDYYKTIQLLGVIHQEDKKDEK
jgi:flagellar protein FlbD